MSQLAHDTLYNLYFTAEFTVEIKKIVDSPFNITKVIIFIVV